jgi:hypothetical protein
VTGGPRAAGRAALERPGYCTVMFAVTFLPLIVAVIVAVPAATPRTPNVVCGLLLPGPIVVVVGVTVATSAVRRSGGRRSAVGGRLSGIRPGFGHPAEIRPLPGQLGS